MFVRRCVEYYLELTSSYYREMSYKLYLPLRGRNLLIISSSNIFYMQMLYSNYLMEPFHLLFVVFPLGNKRNYIYTPVKEKERMVDFWALFVPLLCWACWDSVCTVAGSFTIWPYANLTNRELIRWALKENGKRGETFSFLFRAFEKLHLRNFGFKTVSLTNRETKNTIRWILLMSVICSAAYGIEKITNNWHKWNVSFFVRYKCCM